MKRPGPIARCIGIEAHHASVESSSRPALPLIALIAAIVLEACGCGEPKLRRPPIFVPPLPDGSIALPSCLDRARWIYVVDESRRLLRFEPTTLGFTEITSGPLTCPASAGALPFSMAVDHDAVAWVLYSDGSLHRVSTLDGHCTGTGFAVGQHGLGTFGMGFASIVPQGDQERLYVAGAALPADDPDAGTPPPDAGAPPGTFAFIDPLSLVATPLGTISGSPELTGNALAELWGFFPIGEPAVARIDPGSGATVARYELASLGPDSLATGAPRAWAFAFWGGDYWIFYRTQTEATTEVYRFRPAYAAGPTDAGAGGSPASLTRMVANTGLTIVGAGVSTCVPFILE